MRNGFQLLAHEIFKTEYIGSRKLLEQYTETRQSSTFSTAKIILGDNRLDEYPLYEFIDTPSPSNRSSPGLEPVCDTHVEFDSMGLIHPRISNFIQSSHAVTDVNGNVAASFFLSDFVQTSVQAVISNGKLGELIPGAPDNAAYEIFLIK